MTQAPDNKSWQAAHVGFANDAFTIDGLAVWRHDWQSTDTHAVRLAHPAYPAQMHDFDVYRIGDAGHPVRFAACELSNGVWGFYVPMAPLAESTGVRLEGTQITRHDAPDGSIRVDLAAVEWSSTHWVESPRVTDLANDRVVLDLWNTDWDATVAFPRERCVRLGFRRYRHAGSLAVEVDLSRLTYRIFPDGANAQALPEAPLGGIADGLEAASRRASEHAMASLDRDGNPYVTQRPHPLAAWRSALLIVFGALVVIGAIALWERLHPHASDRKLDEVPTMPG